MTFQASLGEVSDQLLVLADAVIYVVDISVGLSDCLEVVNSLKLRAPEVSVSIFFNKADRPRRVLLTDLDSQLLDGVLTSIYSIQTINEAFNNTFKKLMYEKQRGYMQVSCSECDCVIT